jgi:hypothetical protein
MAGSKSNFEPDKTAPPVFGGKSRKQKGEGKSGKGAGGNEEGRMKNAEQGLLSIDIQWYRATFPP